jgi:repressor LexA
MFDPGSEQAYAGAMSETLTTRQRAILEFIDSNMRERGYPPSVREIADAVGLNSPATVHNHLATLQKLGYLRRDPTKPRALEVRFDSAIGVAMERRPATHGPLVGDIAAGTLAIEEGATFMGQSQVGKKPDAPKPGFGGGPKPQP